MDKIRIGDIDVGYGEKTFIIAEAGLNHDGDFKLAKKLVKEAFKSDADAVKFQIFKTEEFINGDAEYFELFKSLEFNFDEWAKLAELADELGIIFSASVFDEASANFLADIGSPVYKIASGDLNHHPLLSQISKKNLPVVLSTGMANLAEIEESINNIYSTGNHEVILMHCVSSYPTEYQDVNLNFIENLKKLFQVPVGFSDHTIGNIIPPIAVSKGADLIEKHFTVDKNLPGPDHKLSLDPMEFAEMVKNIRITESAMGDGVKKITDDEKHIKELGRRSITAVANISKGETITPDKVKILRPGNGIEPKYINSLIGKTVKIDIKKNQTLNWDMVC